MSKIKVDTDLIDENYTPDTEEIQDALGFLMKCSASDLVESWSRISKEWDMDSISQVHKMLCNTGRIHELVEGFRKL